MEPTPQKSRSASGCKCIGPCFYCDEPIDGPHDHDHLPIPWRHGGRETVPACLRCHRLKESGRIDKWPPSAQHAAGEGIQGEAMWFLQLLHNSVAADDGDPRTDRDTALRVIQSCTTAEARIQIANLVGVGLDAAKRKGLDPLPAPH